MGPSLVAQMVKCLPAMQEIWVWSLGREDPLEEGMATHSSILAWKIPTDGGTWKATVHGAPKSWTQLSYFIRFYTCSHLTLAASEKVRYRYYWTYWTKAIKVQGYHLPKATWVSVFHESNVLIARLIALCPWRSMGPCCCPFRSRRCWGVCVWESGGWPTVALDLAHRWLTECVKEWMYNLGQDTSLLCAIVSSLCMMQVWSWVISKCLPISKVLRYSLYFLIKHKLSGSCHWSHHLLPHPLSHVSQHRACCDLSWYPLCPGTVGWVWTESSDLLLPLYRHRPRPDGPQMCFWSPEWLSPGIPEWGWILGKKVKGVRETHVS